MGTGRFVRRRNPAIRIHPVEPSSSPNLTTGHRVGKHRIQGISDEFIPPIVDLSFLDAVISVDDGDDIVVTLFADSSKKYLSTALTGEEPVKEGFLSSEIRRDAFVSYNRSCETCCLPERRRLLRFRRVNRIPVRNRRRRLKLARSFDVDPGRAVPGLHRET